MPLRSGGMVPGWRVRFPTAGVTSYGGTTNPQGTGACDDDNNNFNGAAVQRLTCVLRWSATKLQWYCFDGLWSLAAIGRGDAKSHLIASYSYPTQQHIPNPGDARFRFNLWLHDGAPPVWGRRTHGIITNFEFSGADVDLDASGYPATLNVAQRALSAAADAGSSPAVTGEALSETAAGGRRAAELPVQGPVQEDALAKLEQDLAASGLSDADKDEVLRLVERTAFEKASSAFAAARQRAAETGRRLEAAAEGALHNIEHTAGDALHRAERAALSVERFLGFSGREALLAEGPIESSGDPDGAARRRAIGAPNAATETWGGGGVLPFLQSQGTTVLAVVGGILGIVALSGAAIALGAPSLAKRGFENLVTPRHARSAAAAEEGEPIAQRTRHARVQPM